LRWPDMIRAIAQQFGKSFTDEEIDDMTYEKDVIGSSRIL